MVGDYKLEYHLTCRFRIKSEMMYHLMVYLVMKNEVELQDGVWSDVGSKDPST